MSECWRFPRHQSPKPYPPRRLLQSLPLHRSLPCLLLRVQYLLRRHLRKLLLRQSLLHALSPHLELLLLPHLLSPPSPRLLLSPLSPRLLLSPLFPRLQLLRLLREPEWSLLLVAGISLW